MMRVVWLTDIHFNFLTPPQIYDLTRHVLDQAPDAILISGDIGEAPTVITYLRELERQLARPIYFVLGNHDFYHGSIEKVRAEVAKLCAAWRNLRYLPGEGVVELTPDTALVGHDGWADGRLGDFHNSDVMLTDYRLIEELREVSGDALLKELNRLGDEAAAHFRRFLPIACEKYRHVFALTHVPPFRDACWYEGQISNDMFLPHFASRCTGDAMREVMLRYPDTEFTVLCGHTHGAGECQILPNLRVLTGSAAYGTWKIERVFETSTSLFRR